VAGFACRQLTVTVRAFRRRPPFASDGLPPPFLPPALRGLLAPVLSLFPPVRHGTARVGRIDMRAPTLVVGREDGRCTCRQGCVLDRARLPLGQARESAVLEGPEQSGFLPVSRSSGKGQARSDRNFNGRMELWNYVPGEMLRTPFRSRRVPTPCRIRWIRRARLPVAPLVAPAQPKPRTPAPWKPSPPRCSGCPRRTAPASSRCCWGMTRRGTPPIMPRRAFRGSPRERKRRDRGLTSLPPAGRRGAINAGAGGAARDRFSSV